MTGSCAIPLLVWHRICALVAEAETGAAHWKATRNGSFWIRP